MAKGKNTQKPAKKATSFPLPLSQLGLFAGWIIRACQGVGGQVEASQKGFQQSPEKKNGNCVQSHWILTSINQPQGGLRFYSQTEKSSEGPNWASGRPNQVQTPWGSYQIWFGCWLFVCPSALSNKLIFEKCYGECTQHMQMTWKWNNNSKIINCSFIQGSH